MRYFVIIALIVAGVIFFRQQTTQKTEGPKKTAQVAAQPTLTPRPASEHDWAKAAIDRTNEVRQQVKRERTSNEVP
jgi:cell division protein FtsN